MLTSKHGDNQDHTNSVAKIFRFENQEVRFVGTADDPWWVAKDICDVLEISDVSNALKNLDDDEKDTHNVRTLGGNQSMLVINESGLYSLILRSRKPQAKKFKKWITSEVLPAIRKTGSYSINQPQKSTIPMHEMLILAELGCKSAIDAGVDKEVAEQLKLEGMMKLYPESKEVLKPYREAIAASKPLPEMPMTPTEIGEELAERLGYEKISAKRVNRKLLELGYQISITRTKRSTGKEVHDYYQATEKGKPHSQLQMSAYTEEEGKSTKAQLKWFSSIITVLAKKITSF